MLCFNYFKMIELNSLSSVLGKCFAKFAYMTYTQRKWYGNELRPKCEKTVKNCLEAGIKTRLQAILTA